MTIYRIIIERPAAKQLARIPAADQTRIAVAINKLASTPKPAGIVKLYNAGNFYRLRVGTYRIIYSLFN